MNKEMSVREFIEMRLVGVNKELAQIKEDGDSRPAKDRSYWMGRENSLKECLGALDGMELIHDDNSRTKVGPQ